MRRLALTLFLAACTLAPAPIRDEIAVTARTNAHAATVVFFTDFQCPYCRKTHAAIAPLLRARRDRVRVVVRQVPLPRHPDARTAARASVCVERLTPMLADDYNDALYTAEDLSEGACEALAVERGVDQSKFQNCLADASTNARIEHDIALFDAVHGDGVPLIYIGQDRLEGAQDSSALAASLDEELRAR